MALAVSPLTLTIGAEITGVDLAVPSDAEFAKIRAAFLRHKVLFFRDQRLGRASQIALGRRFGELMRPNVMAEKTDFPEIYVLRSGGESARPTTDCWHVDSTYMAEPAMMSILRAVEVPPVGGDTLWADMEAAHDTLSPAMKAKLAGLRSLNSIAKLSQFPGYDGRVKAVEDQWPAVEHPIVRTHPETGRKSVFINRMTAISVPGLDSADGEALLEALYRLAESPEIQCRWRWRPGDVAMWDNRCTQHYAVCDYLPAPRLMERVTVRGDRPF